MWIGWRFAQAWKLVLTAWSGLWTRDRSWWTNCPVTTRASRGDAGACLRNLRIIMRPHVCACLRNLQPSSSRVRAKPPTAFIAHCSLVRRFLLATGRNELRTEVRHSWQPLADPCGIALQMLALRVWEECCSAIERAALDQRRRTGDMT
ncbi:hypothetical protein BKA93DRAFT_574261 [Sparassis latifolia]